MANSTLVKLSCALILCIVMVAPHAEALTCGQVSSNVAPCIGYLRSGGSQAGPCCNGVKNLNGLARSTADKQTACGCLKSLSETISGINFGRAGGLPGACGVSVPYSISPNTDCSKIH